MIERTNALIRPSSPRSSRISSTTARYSRSSSRVRLGGGAHVRALVDLHAQDAVRVGVRRAGHAAVERHERGDAAPAERDALRHFGDDADLGVAGAAPGDEQHARIACRRRPAASPACPGNTTASSRETSLRGVMHARLRPILDDVND